MVLDPRLLHQGLLNTDPGVFALQIAETRAQNVFMTRTSGWPARQDELSSRLVLTHPSPIRADRSVPSRIAGRARARRHHDLGPRATKTAHTVRAMSWPSRSATVQAWA